MRGFEVSDIAREFVSKVDKTTFETIVQIVRASFPKCDFYTGRLPLEGKIIIGSKTSKGVPVFKLGKKDKNSKGEWVSLHKDKDKNNNIVEKLKIEVEKNIDKSMYQPNREYHFSIENFDADQFTKFIEGISNSDFIQKRMHGNERYPDSYLQEKNYNKNSSEVTSEHPSSSVDDLPNSSRDEEITGQTLELEERIIKGGKIYASKKEKELTKIFTKWLMNDDQYSLERLEQPVNNRDRIDVVLRDKNKKTIYAELKSVSSYSGSPKRAIRAALGQILDYQYYDGKPKASELWIVLDNCEITEEEKKFINILNVKLRNLNLKLVFENKGAFYHFK